MATYLAEAALEALYQFLTDATYGFNAVLATRRTAEGWTAAQLPDVGTFARWFYRGSQQTGAAPYLAIVPESSTPDGDPNSRMTEVRLRILIVVLDAMIAGSEAEVVQAAWRYADTLAEPMYRRLPKGKQGWTLSDGGTAATGRIVSATVEAQELLVDPDLTAPNAAISTRIAVTLAEDY